MSDVSDRPGELPGPPRLRPRPDEMSNARRLRFLIEGHRRLSRKYDRAYGHVATTLQLVREAQTPALAGLSAEERDELEVALAAYRDETARGFSQSLMTLENAVNELAPGTFPRDEEPFTSFDLGEWFGKVLEWLIDGLHLAADLFGALGLDAVEDGLNWAADALDDLHQFGEDSGLWGEQDDQDGDDDDDDA